MTIQQWLSLRAFRLQGEAFLNDTVNGAKFAVPKDLGVLIRYQTTAERAFHKAHNELVKAKKQRINSKIGFEVRRSKPAWSRECESLTGKEQRSILTPSLAWGAAR